MTIVKIDQFEGYDIDEFIAFLATEVNGEFEIIIPKETVLSYCTNEEISLEFAIAAYMGQKLKEMSTKFEYSAADIANPSQFAFVIETSNSDLLGELLAEASSVFGNSATIEPINFPVEVSTFMEEYKGKEVACKDLFEIAHEYLPDEAEDD